VPQLLGTVWARHLTLVRFSRQGPLRIASAPTPGGTYPVTAVLRAPLALEPCREKVQEAVRRQF
jgi:hypothetical protein